MVGNKCDMEDERVIPAEKGKHLAEQLGMCCAAAPSAGIQTNLKALFAKYIVYCVDFPLYVLPSEISPKFIWLFLQNFAFPLIHC